MKQQRRGGLRDTGVAIIAGAIQAAAPNEPHPKVLGLLVEELPRQMPTTVLTVRGPKQRRPTRAQSLVLNPKQGQHAQELVHPPHIHHQYQKSLLAQLLISLHKLTQSWTSQVRRTSNGVVATSRPYYSVGIQTKIRTTLWKPLKFFDIWLHVAADTSSRDFFAK